MASQNTEIPIYLSHKFYSWNHLQTYTIPVLKDIAKKRFNLNVPSRILKNDLMAMIEEAQPPVVVDHDGIDEEEAQPPVVVDHDGINEEETAMTVVVDHDGINEEETAMTVVTQNEIISLPISIEAYGQVTEQEWQECVEANIQSLTGHGYVQKFEFNRDTDSHVLLFSHPDLKFHAISSRGDIQAFDKNNNDIDIESINVWEILESLD